MKCQQVSNKLSPYLDDQLSQLDRQMVVSHLARCVDCARSVEGLAQLRRNLQSLGRVTPPQELKTSLRIIASRELARRNSRASVSATFDDWRASVRVWMSGLMRPFAVPVAGGLVSAVMLFAMLLPSFIHPAMRGSDVPTGLYTEASIISTGPILCGHDDIEVEMVIDGQGRLIDYTLPQSVLSNPDLKRQIERDLLLVQFSPATTFGRPISGQVKLSFKRLLIDVKG
jgi:hypothetical protein